MKRTIILTVWIYLLVVGMFSWMLFGTQRTVVAVPANEMIIDSSALADTKRQGPAADTVSAFAHRLIFVPTQ
jgi:hypothetical protein